jgi:NADPH:quinone reductase-like Zn-dependent oxidoreductase
MSTRNNPQSGLTIQTFGLNRMDLMQREGKYPLPAGASKTVMGVEFAGTVTKAGEGVEKFKEGDEVFGLAYGVSQPLSRPESKRS